MIYLSVDEEKEENKNSIIKSLVQSVRVTGNYCNLQPNGAVG